MSEIILDTITGKSTATTITIGSTPVVSASANSMTIRGEGTAQTSIQQGLAKCWGNLDGSGTIAIKDSNNISSITDTGVGQYVFIYTSNMANDDYALSGSAGDILVKDCVLMLPAASKTVSQVGVRTGQSNNTDIVHDAPDVSTIIHGDLA